MKNYLGLRIVSIQTCVALLLLGEPLAAQYQQEIPNTSEEALSVVSDSILIPVRKPVELVFSLDGWESKKSAEVWLRLTIGEAGVVTEASVAYCDLRGQGYEQAALEAAVDAIFMPHWDVPYPGEYVGYYPVTYLDATKARYPLQRRSRSTVRGFGFDAPIIYPLQQASPKYPKKALKNLVEGEVRFRILVNERGKAVSINRVPGEQTGYGFDKAASKTLRRSKFPIKTLNGRNKKYAAYTRVRFKLTNEQIVSAGLPLPTANIDFDVAPIFLFGPEKLYAPEMASSSTMGVAWVRVLVNTIGSVITSRIDSSCGDKTMDNLALDWSKHRKYKPAQSNGDNIPAWTSYPEYFLNPEPDTSEQLYTAESGDYPDAANLAYKYFDVESPEIQPKFEHYEKCDYSILLIEAEIKGKVQVAALIGEDGSILETRIAHSSGFAVLDSLAEAVTAHHRFHPATTDGKPVKAWISWPVAFSKSSRGVNLPDRFAKPHIVYPEMIHVEPPVYPDSARDAGLEGIVWLNLHVSKNGRVLESTILESSGYPILDTAAWLAAPRHLFDPATQDGKPISFWLKYQVNFQLE